MRKENEVTVFSFYFSSSVFLLFQPTDTFLLLFNILSGKLSKKIENLIFVVWGFFQYCLFFWMWENALWFCFESSGLDIVGEEEERKKMQYEKRKKTNERNIFAEKQKL